MIEVNQPLPNLSNVVSKVKSRSSADERPRKAPVICDNIVVPQIIIQDTDLEPLTPLISDNIIVPENLQDTLSEPITAEKEADLKFSVSKTGNNSNPVFSGGLDLFEEFSWSYKPEQADKIEENCSINNNSDIVNESSELNLVTDHVAHQSEVDSLPNLVNSPMVDRTSYNLPGENDSSRLFTKQIEEEKKEVKIVGVEDTISDSFSEDLLLEDLSNIEITEKIVAESQPHIDPSRFVSYPDDLRPSFRLPQRLTSRRSTVFLQSSLCCCQASRENRRGLSWIFSCFRTK